MSPEPVTAMAARGPEVGGGQLANLSNYCQMVYPQWFVLFYSVPEYSEKFPRGYLKRHKTSRELF